MPNVSHDATQDRIALPSLNDWPDVTSSERAYREAKLREIERRIAADGPHAARAHALRARQFMPFAALKGYEELVHEQAADAQTDIR